MAACFHRHFSFQEINSLSYFGDTALLVFLNRSTFPSSRMSAEQTSSFAATESKAEVMHSYNQRRENNSWKAELCLTAFGMNELRNTTAAAV